MELRSYSIGAENVVETISLSSVDDPALEIGNNLTEILVKKGREPQRELSN